MNAIAKKAWFGLRGLLVVAILLTVTGLLIPGQVIVAYGQECGKSSEFWIFPILYVSGSYPSCGAEQFEYNPEHDFFCNQILLSEEKLIIGEYGNEARARCYADFAHGLLTSYAYAKSLETDKCYSGQYHVYGHGKATIEFKDTLTFTAEPPPGIYGLDDFRVSISGYISYLVELTELGEPYPYSGSPGAGLSSYNVGLKNNTYPISGAYKYGNVGKIWKINFYSDPPRAEVHIPFNLEIPLVPDNTEINNGNLEAEVIVEASLYNLYAAATTSWPAEVTAEAATEVTVPHDQGKHKGKHKGKNKGKNKGKKKGKNKGKHKGKKK